MDELRKMGKMKALQDLRAQAMGKMKGGLDGLQKVTVASPDKEGLEAGLEKAKDMVGKPEEEDQEHPFAGKETPGEENAEAEIEAIADEMSSDELDKLINILQEKKAKKMGDSDASEAPNALSELV